MSDTRAAREARCVWFPVPVFCAAGADRWREVQELRGDERIRLVASPRHASVLVVAGTIPATHRAALDRVHDQLPHPRTVVTWAGRHQRPTVDRLNGLTTDIIDAFAGLLDDPTMTTPDRLDDEEPNEWRGVGPFGQGGEGMMGGTPYGRPMAMTGDDRDGLSLDRLDLRLGPFLDALPGGLLLDVTLQGEIVQSVEFQLASTSHGDEHAADPGRVADDLRWLTHALHVQGLEAHAVRAARLASATGAALTAVTDSAATGDVATVRAEFAALRRMMRWSGLRAALRGVGEFDGGDARMRWSARLDRIGAAIDGRVDDGSTDHPFVVDANADVLASRLPSLLEGMTLTDAVSTLVSFDPCPSPAPATESA